MPEAAGDPGPAAPEAEARRTVIGDALAVGVATGAYGISFGALTVAAGLSIYQAVALSALMFTGASQFAFVGLVAGGAWPAAATAVLLGARNAFYSVSLARILEVRGLRRLGAAHLVIDESTAMAVGQPTPARSRLGFYAAGLSVFALWNLGTVAGAVGAKVLADPRTLGLDAAAPAAFLALLSPRLRSREPWAVALGGAAVALLLAPITPAGVPVLAAAGVAVIAVVVRPDQPDDDAARGAEGET